MGIFDKLSRKKRVPTENDRREHLDRVGRITDGTIIDRDGDGDGEIAYYFYSVHGVDFESSERLSAEMLEDPVRYAAGAKVGVKFDPKNHGNSMLV